MDKLPQVSGKELCKILEKDGFVFIRQTGSHKIYKKTAEEGAVVIPVPVHSSKPLKKARFTPFLKRPASRGKSLFF